MPKHGSKKGAKPKPRPKVISVDFVTLEGTENLVIQLGDSDGIEDGSPQLPR